MSNVCTQARPALFRQITSPARRDSGFEIARAFRLALCLLAAVVAPLTLRAQTFTNSGTLAVSKSGTNLVLQYSLTTTQGWVTLLAGDTLTALGAVPQPMTYTQAPPSKLGQFRVPMGPTNRTKFYRLSLDPWPTNFLNYPDLGDSIPTGGFSITGTGTNRQFQYTHDTYNDGTGPLEIQPVYNSASGNYQGYQHVYYLHSGTWTLVKTIPVAGAFVFDVAHGHFHFPFSTYGLYAASTNGGIGPVVALSPKTGFCIGDSYLIFPALPNAGVFGNLGACTDPTSLRGLSIGYADEYDRTDEGQSIPVPNLTNGVYWLRSIVDPFNYLAESDETNNETDTKLAITNNSITVLQTVVPALTPPPGITLTVPAAGNVSGIVQLTASTPVIGGSGVQFLVDGLPFGNVVSNAPYVLAWDTTFLPNGTHWLAAQIADSTGHYGTSPITLVNVNNGSTIPPTVQLTDPESNSIVSAVITVSATAAAQVGVPSVQFYVDNVALGSPDTNPPFTTIWNTQTATAGLHVVTATATDSSSLTSTSAPVTVTVDNSHPANVIGTNVVVAQDGTGTIITPVFSTTAEPTLLVAFVAYDGPVNSSQTATVSGAGLSWQLAKRSNTQHGTSEIWTAMETDFLSSVTITSTPSMTGYHGSLTVIAFTNASGPGIVGQASAASGAPDVFIPGVTAGNWVFAVGNDWDNATARTPVSGQVLIHQKLDSAVGDTFWVQATAGPSVADALVDIHDNAPTADRWNYVAVEIVATRQ